jgi:hypothetical protein
MSTATKADSFCPRENPQMCLIFQMVVNVHAVLVNIRACRLPLDGAASGHRGLKGAGVCRQPRRALNPG